MFDLELGHLREQHTIRSPVAFIGIGLHSGRRVTLRILPTEAGHGIAFTRRDLPASEGHFAAHWDAVSGTELCTTVGNRHGHHIGTVEHLLSAFNGLGIDNAEVVLDGPEVPVVDGSAMPFVAALQNAGLRPLGVPRDLLVVRRPVRMQYGEQWAELLPDTMPRVTLSIDFQHEDIGHQCLSFCLSPTTFVREIAPARTFGFAEQLWQLRSRGLAQGGSIKNAILLREGRVANLEGLRFPDEFVRHKALDVIGDLSLAGLPIIGHYRANRPGHRINNDLLRLLMNDRESWQRVSAPDLLDRADRAAGHRAADAGASTQRPRAPALVGRDPNWRRVVDRMLGVKRKNDA